MNETPWLYFFSANAQVFAGLVAILGVFVVYALQAIQGSIEWSRSDLVRLWKPHSVDLEPYALDKQMERSKECLDDRRSKAIALTEMNEIERVMNVIRDRRTKRTAVTEEFKCIVILDLILLGVSLLLLPWSKQICECTSLAAFLVVLVLGASIYALVKMGQFIYSAI